MRAALLLALLGVAEARPTGLIIGIDIGASVPTDDAAWFGDAPEIMTALGARPSDGRLGDFAGLRLGWQLAEWLALEARARHIQVSYRSRFEAGPALDYGLKRSIIPINVMPRLTLDNEVLGLAIGGGPGLYQVDFSQSGYLGDRDFDTHQWSYVFEAALGVHFLPWLTGELTMRHDWLDLDPGNALIADGGDGNLWSWGLALTVTLGG